MKNKPVKSITATILGLAGLVLLIMNYSLIASIVFMAAYFINMGDLFKISGTYQFINCWVIVSLLGFAVESPLNGHFPYITLSLLCSFPALFGRGYWTDIFSYSGHLWFEWLFGAACISLYVVGNLVHPMGWRGWAIPVPIVVMSSLMGLRFVADAVRLKGAAHGATLAEVGKAAPDFALPDQEGKEVKLSDFKDQRHLLLLFVKGDWCPACHMMLRTYQKEKEKFQEKNIVTVAIGPDPVGVNRKMVDNLGVDYKVLSDDKHTASSKYGLPVFDEGKNGQENGFALPASFLIDKTGIIRYTSRPDKVGEFLNPSLIFPILERLS